MDTRLYDHDTLLINYGTTLISNAAWQRKHTQKSKRQWITTIICLLLFGVLLTVLYYAHASRIKELENHNYALESRIKTLENHTQEPEDHTQEPENLHLTTRLTPTIRSDTNTPNRFHPPTQEDLSYDNPLVGFQYVKDYADGFNYLFADGTLTSYEPSDGWGDWTLVRLQPDQYDRVRKIRVC